MSDATTETPRPVADARDATAAERAAAVVTLTDGDVRNLRIAGEWVMSTSSVAWVTKLAAHIRDAIAAEIAASEARGAAREREAIAGYLTREANGWAASGAGCPFPELRAERDARAAELRSMASAIRARGEGSGT